jgi:tetratricopeptide (TPR) repeat protein
MSNGQYPGTSTLPPEVQQRVISTFKHSLDLAQQGNNDEANMGVDFILNLDPQFEPAQQLADKLRNPFSSVQLEDLVAQFSHGDPLGDAREALSRRDFSRALEITSEVLRNDMMNVDAQQIAEEAQSKMEAGPFIQQFVKTAEAKLASGNRTGAAQDLEKAKQLDPTNPMVRDLERRFDDRSAGSTAPPAFSNPFGSGFGDAPSGDAFSTPPPASSDFAFGGAGGEAPTQTFSFGEPAAPATDSGFGFGGSSPSFVVDSQPGASGAPAADFGFTFEEEKAADPGPFVQPKTITDSPFERGEANTFDFATASVETTPEDREKVGRYLSEGDAAYESGDYQRAIDTWSKIFLIDVTNDDASERIERARSKRQEADRRIEELMVAGTLAFEKRDYATAKTKFEQVVSLDPNHFNAREYLERLESDGSLAPTMATPMPRVSPSADTAIDSMQDDFGDELASPDVLAPPEPKVAAKKSTAPSTTTKPAKKAAPILPLALVAVLLLLGGAGYFVYSRFFSSAGAADPALTRQTFTKADRLAKNGHYDEAIALLASIPPADPEHDRALEMIDDLKVKKAQGSGLINGRPAAEVFAGLVQKGRESFAAHDYLTAKQAFEQASAIQQLPPDAKQLSDAASQQVAKLDTAMVLLKEGKYPEGITNLEGLLQQDPQNATIRQLLVKAHFNLAASALQVEDTDSALGELDQALALDPNDVEARRTRELAGRYSGQSKDLMYKIYVKYLPPRPI